MEHILKFYLDIINDNAETIRNQQYEIESLNQIIKDNRKEINDLSMIQQIQTNMIDSKEEQIQLHVDHIGELEDTIKDLEDIVDELKYDLENNEPCEIDKVGRSGGNEYGI